jgi:hypothetical protein
MEGNRTDMGVMVAAQRTALAKLRTVMNYAIAIHPAVEDRLPKHPRREIVVAEAISRIHRVAVKEMA